MNRIMKNEMLHRSIRDDQFRYNRKQMCEMALTHEILKNIDINPTFFFNLLELQGSPEKNLIHIFPRHFFCVKLHKTSYTTMKLRWEKRMLSSFFSDPQKNFNVKKCGLNVDFVKFIQKFYLDLRFFELG